MMTKVGTSIVARSGVESGRSAIPSAAAAIASAGWSRIQPFTTSHSPSGGSSERSGGGLSTRTLPSAMSRPASVRRASAPSGVSAPARVLARISPANRSGARRQRSNATYPPMERPQTTTRSKPAASSASRHRRAPCSIVSTPPSATGLPPNPGRSGATTFRRSIWALHIRASSGKAWISRSPSVIAPPSRSGRRSRGAPRAAPRRRPGQGRPAHRRRTP